MFVASSIKRRDESVIQISKLVMLLIIKPFGKL